MNTIIVFSHLRWDFVYQRPQQILSRLAEHYNILYFEEPVYSSTDSYLEYSTPLKNVTVCRPHTPVNVPGFHRDQLPYLRQMLEGLVEENQLPKDSLLGESSRLLVWFYTPMALPLLSSLPYDDVVFDVMDELSAFKNPPAGLLENEAQLLSCADIVFTGGPSLYRAKQHRNRNVYCLPSSVDVVHFRSALDRSTAHPSMKDLAAPRLGFFGVIDERFDIDLVRTLALARPEWQIILVGPVVKIDADALPRLPNIHYFGQRDYSELPQFLAGWDVCLMPFAINESTRFISPTKSLEYMAAELPIVSTPIRDVVDLHSDVVLVASDPASFISACDTALAMSPIADRALASAMRKKLATTSWDQTASKMVVLLDRLDNAPLLQRANA
jgi:UDP-galactopyranose mutase